MSCVHLLHTGFMIRKSYGGWTPSNVISDAMLTEHCAMSHSYVIWFTYLYMFCSLKAKLFKNENSVIISSPTCWSQKSGEVSHNISGASQQNSVAAFSRSGWGLVLNHIQIKHLVQYDLSLCKPRRPAWFENIFSFFQLFLNVLKQVPIHFRMLQHHFDMDVLWTAKLCLTFHLHGGEKMMTEY